MELLTREDTSCTEHTSDILSANDWLSKTRTRRPPATLFGDLWLEGELTVLFGDRGSGKSILAMQIAESIARGKAIGPFDMTADVQTVFYLDLKLGERQFELRYSADHDGKSKCLQNPYVFSRRLKRDVPPRSTLDAFERTPEISLPNYLKQKVKASGAKVVIIDNLSCFKQTADGFRELARLMRALRRLRNDLDLSILVIAHSARRKRARVISDSDLQGEKLILGLIDNLFAIGHSLSDTRLRYIKHLRSSSTEIVFDAIHLPAFEITKAGRNFLSFDHLGFATESQIIGRSAEDQEWQRIRRIRQLRAAKKKTADIAKELDISRATLYRLLKIAESAPLPWNKQDEPEPPAESDETETDAFETDEFDDDSHEDCEGCDECYAPSAEDCLLAECNGCDFCFGRPGNRWETSLERIDFSKHVPMVNCADDCGVCGPRVYLDTDKVAKRRRELSKQFLEALRQWTRAGKPTRRPEYGKEYCLPSPGMLDGSENAGPGEDHHAFVDIPAASVGSDDPLAECMTPRDVLIACGFTLGSDNNDREIFVEEFLENGKPRVWYFVQQNGKVRRWRAGNFGNDGMGALDGPLCPFGVDRWLK